MRSISMLYISQLTIQLVREESVVRPADTDPRLPGPRYHDPGTAPATPHCHSGASTSSPDQGPGPGSPDQGAAERDTEQEVVSGECIEDIGGVVSLSASSFHVCRLRAVRETAAWAGGGGGAGG